MNEKFKFIVIAGAISGVLSSIPCFNLLNACFCLLVGLGVVLGLRMWINALPEEENVGLGDIATFGALAGVVSGIISGIVGALMNLVMQSQLASLYSEMGIPQEALNSMAAGGAVGAIVGICVSVFLHATMGALYGMLASQIMFKDRLS